jgi:hypothetical protein
MTDFDNLTDSEYTAVTDTTDDGLAIVFFVQDGEEIGDAVPDAVTLPTEARHADAILTVEVTEGTLTRATHELDQTESRKQSTQDRFNRLLYRPPRDDDSN